jgi:hypothetical protein
MDPTTHTVSACDVISQIRRESRATPHRVRKWIHSKQATEAEARMFVARMKAALQIIEEAEALGPDHPINRTRYVSVTLEPAS